MVVVSVMIDQERRHLEIQLRPCRSASQKSPRNFSWNSSKKTNQNGAWKHITSLSIIATISQMLVPISFWAMVFQRTLLVSLTSSWLRLSVKWLNQWWNNPKTAWKSNPTPCSIKKEGPIKLTDHKVHLRVFMAIKEVLKLQWEERQQVDSQEWVVLLEVEVRQVVWTPKRCKTWWLEWIQIWWINWCKDLEEWWVDPHPKLKC